MVREGATAEQLYVAGMAALALAQARSESDNAPSDAGENDYADAANLFVRTVRTDPMHFRALYRYWQIRARSGEVPDQRLQDVLVQA